jgi:hypothetical protein
MLTNVLALLLAVGFTGAERPKAITDFAFAPEGLLSSEMEEIKDARTLSVDDLTDKDGSAVLSRIRELPNLKTLRFYSADLSRVDENDPVPDKVNFVLVADGRISQGTIRWLARFPKGVELVFGGCDTRGLELDLGEFKWVTFDNCKVSPAVVAKLVRRLTRVTFKECELGEEGAGDKRRQEK